MNPSAPFFRGLTLIVAVGAVACYPDPPDGRFSCIPSLANVTCPMGFRCELRLPDQEWRCYRKQGPYCGDHVAGKGEECDGQDFGGATCRDRGYLGGALHCEEYCAVSTENCLGVRAASVGTDSVCALDTGSRLWCWGRGDRLGVPSATPLEVVGAPRMSTLVTGAEHACGLDSSGQAWCWGNSDYLGAGYAGGVTHTPQPVVQPVAFEQLTASRDHTCALDGAGRAWCWGLTAAVYGEPEADRLTIPLPERIESSLSFSRIAAGHRHTCALDGAGRALCWGGNELSQGGRMSPDATRIPVAVVGGLRFAKLSAGQALTCGATSSGEAWCWGYGDGPERGADFLVMATPTAVQPERHWSALEVGAGWTCGIDVERAGWCWEHRNALPYPVFFGHELSSLEVGTGSDTVCAGTRDGTHLCLGWNGASMTTLDASTHTPAAVVPDETWQQVAVGGTLSCGLGADGQARCWGAGGLGDGVVHYRPTPEPQPVSSGALTLTSLSVGYDHACGLDDAGRALCWGNNRYGATGPHTALEDVVLEPSLVRPEPFVRIAAGVDSTCAIDASDRAFCWGRNWQGKLGNGSWADTTTPTLVSGDHYFADISPGDQTTCAVDVAGQAWCWGGCAAGMCGAAQGGMQSTPVPVEASGVSFATITTLSYGACALDTEQRAWCWGQGDRGQIGDGGLQQRDFPTPVAGDHRFVVLQGGRRFACGLDTAQQVWCWGANDRGALGDATYLDRSVPASVAVPQAQPQPDGIRFKALAVGRSGSHACAIALDDGLWCWGNNAQGQTGAQHRVVLPVLVSRN